MFQLLDIRDEGTDRLEHSRPAHVDVYYHFEDIPAGRYGLIIAVTPCLYECETPILYYHPAVLHLGVGCRKQCNPTGIWAYIGDELKRHTTCFLHRWRSLLIMPGRLCC